MKAFTSDEICSAIAFAAGAIATACGHSTLCVIQTARAPGERLLRAKLIIHGIAVLMDPPPDSKQLKLN